MSLDAIASADAQAYGLAGAPERKRERQRFEYVEFLT